MNDKDLRIRSSSEGIKAGDAFPIPRPDGNMWEIEMPSNPSNPIILCTHHKGGVGKTELAIHLCGALRNELKRVLLVDCDSQASSWGFYFGETPTAMREPRQAADRLQVLWNPDRTSIKKTAEDYDVCVLDMTSPLVHTVRTIVQDEPSDVFIPVNLAYEALSMLKDPLRIIAELREKAGYRPRVCIVPLGSRTQDIRLHLDELKKLHNMTSTVAECKIAARVRNLQKETNRARMERRYVWEYPECADLKEYFRALLSSQ